MRCDCCDKSLDDEEATARFAESGNYVSMCRGCRVFLPKQVKILTRSDLIGKKKEEEDPTDDWLANNDPLYFYGDEDE